MNDRIKELAGETLDHAMPQTWCSVSPDELDRILEKFAELIVRECAGVTLDYKNNDHYTGWCDHAEEILRHFGVEE